ncbi:MAG: glycosyltransferase [Elusimicrobia bacterium]|nr:glycosyltransferase [Elusimicrobiota bacterium]
MLSVSVIIPSYNERENIAILVPQLHGVLAAREHEILVVDDRSPDGTGEVVEAMAKTDPRLKLLTKERREGIGAALRYGYDRGKNDVLFSLDADLSFDTREALKLLELIDGGADLVLGCRHAGGGSYEAPNLKIKLKFMVSRLGNAVVRALVGLDLHDYSANFRAIRREVWKKISTEENTNSLLLEMILKVKYCGFKIAEVPVSFVDRIHGQSKLNLFVEAPKFLLKLLKYSVQFRMRGA